MDDFLSFYFVNSLFFILLQRKYEITKQNNISLNLIIFDKFCKFGTRRNPPPPMPPPPPGLPINDFLPFFFVFAIAYGVYRNLKSVNK